MRNACGPTPSDAPARGEHFFIIRVEPSGELLTGGLGGEEGEREEGATNALTLPSRRTPSRAGSPCMRAGRSAGDL